MKSVVIRRFGGPRVLRIAERKRPECGRGQLLVEVHASSVNPIDWKIRRGYLPFLLNFPLALGFDLCGRVAQVGAGAGEFKEGDWVYARSDGLTGRAHSEFVSLSAKAAAPKPEGMNVEEAAAVPLAALTALQALRDLGGIEPGQRVLVVGASGGVGHYAVQIAKCYDCRVTAVCGGRNAELARDLGADEVVDYRRENPLEAERPYHIFFDAVAAHSFAKARRAMTPNGAYVTTLPGFSILFWALWTSLAPGRKARLVKVRPSGSDLRQITEYIDSGRLRSVIDSVFPLEEIEQAHRRSETGHVTGKVVVRVREER